MSPGDAIIVRGEGRESDGVGAGRAVAVDERATFLAREGPDVLVRWASGTAGWVSARRVVAADGEAAP